MSKKAPDNEKMHDAATSYLNPGSEPAKEGPSAWDKIASSLSGVGNFASGFVAEQVHAAGQDFVSRVLLNESYSQPDHGLDKDKERAPEPDQGMDR